jgi:hypothetical protein
LSDGREEGRMATFPPKLKESLVEGLLILLFDDTIKESIWRFQRKNRTHNGLDYIDIVGELRTAI